MAEQGVRFRELERAEMEEILARNHVGRLAFTFRDRVDVEPIHYLYQDGVIYCRTTPGTKLTTIAHHPWVAFQVDEVHGPYDWVSVTAHGTVYPLDEGAGDADVRAREEAIALLRERLPEIYTERDPGAFRQIILRIYPADLTGRAAEQG